MSEEGPKLYPNKPKRAQLKQSGKESTSPLSAAAASYTMGSQPQPQPQPPPPPPPPKESFARRFKFLWPLLLTVNAAIGVYLFMRTNKTDNTTEEEDSKAVSSTPVSTITPATVKPVPVPIITEPVKPREPIPEDQQRELFKWILEEKRKIKPRDPEERKRLDEEKAILKQFIRAKSLPSV